MTALAPRSLADLLEALAELPAAQLLAGGTDFMVEVNFGRRDPVDVVALRRVHELARKVISRVDTRTVPKDRLRFTAIATRDPLAGCNPTTRNRS